MVCPVWNTTLDTRVWQDYRLAAKRISEFPLRKRICIRPNFKIGAMDDELLGIGNM